MKPETCFRTTIGGQALIEGIMMRGPIKQAVVVRKPDGDTISQVQELKLIKDRHPILGVPLIRGSVNFLDSMVKGVKALMFSADFYPEDEEPSESKFDLWLERVFGSEKAMKFVIGLAVLFGISFSVGLFILLPTFLAGFLTKAIESTIVCNLIEGAIRIIIFILYLIFCSRFKDMKRVFSYHGAEHKTIFCYEKGLPLTVENARRQTRFHPRCGTSFLFVIMIVSILIFSVVSWSNVWIRMGLRLILLPVVVGITYEINRFVGRHDNALTRIVAAPGLWMQRFTTNEPDDSMLEVAIEALELVLPDQKGADLW
ncbi:MAG: DUF1385 domain-containing protein [Evtepia sp.]